MLLQVNFGAELRCRIVGVGALALGLLVFVLVCRAGLSLWLVALAWRAGRFYRYDLASMPCFEAKS